MPEPLSWDDRVQYSPTGQFAYRPGEVLVPVITPQARGDG